MDNMQHFLYGGDYNPNQWDKTIWQEDLDFLKRHGSIVRQSMFFLGRKFSPQKKSMISMNLMK